MERVDINDPEKSFIRIQTKLIRGGLIGAAITAFLSWNSGKYNRIGIALRRLRFIRHLIKPKKISGLPIMTQYDEPQLKSVVSNFFCYSGQPGIGKSFHFQNLVSKESLLRPALYLSFKTVGKDTNFENDVAEQINFGEEGTAIISQIIRAAKRISRINKHPERFWMKYVMVNLGFVAGELGVYFSNWDAVYGMLGLSGVILGHFYTIYFLQPFLIQSFRKSPTLIVMDDLNKIQQMNMLSQVARFLKLIESNAANIMLVSSDEQTWSHLRKQPGMKDRLRVRQIKYQHLQTSKRLLDSVQNRFELLMKTISGHQIYDKQLVKALVKELIGVRQMTLRRFISVLKLYDQEEYEKLLGILKSRQEKSLSAVIGEFAKVLIETETHTMVVSLKTIKRELRDMTQEEFITNLKLLLEKFKLPSDNKIGPQLKLFNIVRDLRSEYVVTGRFVYIIYQMAVEEYENDWRQYVGYKEKEKVVSTIAGANNNTPAQDVLSSQQVTTAVASNQN